jgi:hypothetical protein
LRKRNKKQKFKANRHRKVQKAKTTQVMKSNARKLNDKRRKEKQKTMQKSKKKNVVKRRFQQKELESAKERQEQMAKEHGIGIETTLNGEEKCGLLCRPDRRRKEFYKEHNTRKEN